MKIERTYGVRFPQSSRVQNLFVTFLFGFATAWFWNGFRGNLVKALFHTDFVFQTLILTLYASFRQDFALVQVHQLYFYLKLTSTLSFGLTKWLYFLWYSFAPSNLHILSESQTISKSNLNDYNGSFSRPLLPFSKLASPIYSIFFALSISQITSFSETCWTFQLFPLSRGSWHFYPLFPGNFDILLLTGLFNILPAVSPCLSGSLWSPNPPLPFIIRNIFSHTDFSVIQCTNQVTIRKMYWKS